MGTERVRVPGFHAAYRCRHSGACCTSNWPISVEADRAERIRAAMASGVLRPAQALQWLPPRAGDADTVLPIVNGHCAFFAADGGRLCRIHSALGHDALPLACRQFPRVVVRDPRGVSVTLSHYCPTAAAALGADGPIAITETAPGFPPGAEYDGLDARGSLPPLLRAGMLMDWESWWEFERCAVELLGDSIDPPDVALDRLRAAVERARTWSPGEGVLIDRVREAFAAARGLCRDHVSLGQSPTQIASRRLEVMTMIPPERRPAAREISDRTGFRVDASDSATRRFLAAHAFASWTIHLGQGLRTWLRSVETAYALIASGSDVREADLLLRHLCDPRALADAWSGAEIHDQARRHVAQSTPAARSQVTRVNR